MHRGNCIGNRRNVTYAFRVFHCKRTLRGREIAKQTLLTVHFALKRSGCECHVQTRELFSNASEIMPTARVYGCVYVYRISRDTGPIYSHVCRMRWEMSNRAHEMHASRMGDRGKKNNIARSRQPAFRLSCKSRRKFESPRRARKRREKIFLRGVRDLPRESGGAYYPSAPAGERKAFYRRSAARSRNEITSAFISPYVQERGTLHGICPNGVIARTFALLADHNMNFIRLRSFGI